MRAQHNNTTAHRPSSSRHLRAALLLLLLLAGIATTATAADTKEAARRARAEAKTLAKEGWQLMGTRETLQQAMANYYIDVATATTEAIRFSAHATDQNPNRAIAQATRRGTAEYAKILSTTIHSETDNTTINQQQGDSITSTTQTIHTSQASTRERIAKLKPRYTLTRKLPDGQTEVMLLYLEQ